MSDNKKNIEIVDGNGSDLDISPVYDNIKSAIPKDHDKKPKHIVIPKEKERKDKNEKGGN